MHTLKPFLLSFVLVLAFSAHAAPGLTEAKFESDLAQLKKNVAAAKTQSEALAVIEKYSLVLKDQARAQREIAKNNAYDRASEMRVRLSTIMSTNCEDDLEATLEFRESSMADEEETEPSADLKRALELAKTLCSKK